MNTLSQFLFGVFSAITGAFLLLALSTLNGTILWSVYPHIFAMFPNAAKAGVLAAELGWWDAVCITFIFGLLIKSSQSNTNNSK